MANGKPWLPAHTDTLRRMNAVGYTDEEIAALTGHCRETVTRNRLKAGLDCSYRQKARLTFKITSGAYG